MSFSSASRALLLALLAVVPTFPLPSPDAAGPLVSVEAVPSADGLSIRVRSDEPDLPVSVVVSHQDPLLGEVVDRVIPLASGGTADVELAGLRADATFSIRALPADAPLPRLSPVLDLVDGEALADVPVLAEATVTLPAPDDGPAVRAFPAFPVARERGDERTSRVVVTRSGMVVVAWMEPTAWYNASTQCMLHVAASRDGGRTYTAPASPRAPFPSVNGGCYHPWTVAEAAGGEVLVVEDAQGDAEGAWASLYDPAAGAFVSRVRVRGDPTFREPVAAASLPDGSVALAFSDGRVDGTQHPGVSLWRLRADGSLGPMASFEGLSHERLRVATSEGDDVAVAWSAGGNVSYALSRDGGRSFAESRLPVLTRTGQLALHHATMDEAGTLHLTARDYSTGEAFYARVPPGGSADVRPLCGDDARALLQGCVRAQDPFLIAARGRVWLLFEGFVETWGWQDPRAVRQYAAESTDGGVTFDAPYAVEDYPGNRVSTPYDTAVLPDGRPLLLGYYFFERASGGEDAWIATVPVFDPLASAESGLTVLRNATAGALALAVSPVGASPALAGSGLVSMPTDALRVDLRNVGASAAPEVRVALEDLPSALRVAAPVEPFRLAAAGRIRVDVPLEGLDAWDRTATNATLVLTLDGLPPVRLPIRLGEPSAAPPPTPSTPRAVLSWRALDATPIDDGRGALVRATIANDGDADAPGVGIQIVRSPVGATTLGPPPFDVSAGRSREVEVKVGGLPPASAGMIVANLTLSLPGHPEAGDATVGLRLPTAATTAREDPPTDAPPTPVVPSTPAQTSATPSSPSTDGNATSSASRQAGPAIAPEALVAGAAVAGLAAVAGVALATEAGKLGLLAGAASLYSRIARSDVLTNEVRAGVHRRIQEKPGLRFEELRADLGLANGTLAFHLRVLERERYVVVRREWTRRRFYPAAAKPAQPRALADAAILQALASEPGGLTPSEVARRLGISRQLARYHLLALARDGRAHGSRDGRALRYVPGRRVVDLHPVEREG